jgi:DNA-binding PadR family transcriptional regulator
VLVLELAVLGLLKESPMSGYELKKQLTVKLGAFWRVSFGSLYPCLKRLLADGALVQEKQSTSRKKHVYRLTARGEQLFLELLESADVRDLEQDRFSLRLAFFRYLRPETRLDQLERRRGYLQDRLAHLRASLRTVRDRLDAYTLELMDHGLDEHEREIAWLDRLIAAERGGPASDLRTARSRSTSLMAESAPEGTGLPAQQPTPPRDPRLPTQTGQAAPTK